MNENISELEETLEKAKKEKQELNSDLYLKIRLLDEQIVKAKKIQKNYKVLQKLEKEKKDCLKKIQDQNRYVNKKYPIVQKKHNYYSSSLSREAYLSYKKGSRPWEEWSRKELLRYDPTLDFHSTWTIRFHLLEQTGKHHIGKNHEYKIFYSLKPLCPLNLDISFASCRRYVFKNNKRTCEYLSGIILDGMFITCSKRLFPKNKSSLFDWKISLEAGDFKNASRLIQLKDQILQLIDNEKETREWNDF